MRIDLYQIGKTRESWIKTGEQEYLQRIRRYCQIQAVVLKAADHSDRRRAMDAEGQRILQKMQDTPYAILLDERGKSMTSQDLAHLLSKLRDSGHHRVAFFIGGAYGVTDQVRDNANAVLSLSPLTFPHQLVRVVLLEQLYRAFTILSGQSYHH